MFVEVGLWKDTQKPGYGTYYRIMQSDSVLVHSKFDHFAELSGARAFCNAAAAVARAYGFKVVTKGLTKEQRKKDAIG